MSQIYLLWPSFIPKEIQIRNNTHSWVFRLWNDFKGNRNYVLGLYDGLLLHFLNTHKNSIFHPILQMKKQSKRVSNVVVTQRVGGRAEFQILLSQAHCFYNLQSATYIFIQCIFAIINNLLDSKQVYKQKSASTNEFNKSGNQLQYGITQRDFICISSFFQFKVNGREQFIQEV